MATKKVTRVDKRSEKEIAIQGKCLDGYKLCEQSCIADYLPCNDDCGSSMVICDGKCQEKTFQCNGECLNGYYAVPNCNGTCSHVQEKWLCGSNCTDTAEPCGGQCPAGKRHTIRSAKEQTKFQNIDTM